MSRVLGRGNGYELHMIHNVRPAVELPRIIEADRAGNDLRHPNRFRRAVVDRAEELKRDEAAITAALCSWMRSRACRDRTLNRCQISAERMRCRQAHS